MGGNALSLPSVRLCADVYFKVEDSCVQSLRKAFPDCRVEPILAYREKRSFGDLDILVSREGFDPVAASSAFSQPSHFETVRNGPVTSYGIRVGPEPFGIFQVDIITAPADQFEAALNYFNYNDLGNLLGRIAHSMGGLKLGHDGLTYPVRAGDGNHVLGIIPIYTDYSKIIPLIGLDYSRFQAGFDSLEQIFEFVASSTYFNSDIYLLHNRNATGRIRDKKRKTYMDFLTWLERRPNLSKKDEVRPSRSDWLAKFKQEIPGFESKYEEIMEERRLNEALKLKFNGNLISEWTELEGKPLGQFMAAFNALFASKQDMRSCLLSCSPEKIKQTVLDFHSVFK
jgi:hypothetical protein